MGEKITEPFPFCVDDFFPKGKILLHCHKAGIFSFLVFHILI